MTNKCRVPSCSSPGVWTDGVTITAANLDTNNGLQDPATGARFCNLN